MKTICQRIDQVKAPTAIHRHSMFKVIGERRATTKTNPDSNMDPIRSQIMTEGREYPIGPLQNPIRVGEPDHNHLDQHIQIKLRKSAQHVGPLDMERHSTADPCQDISL